MSDLDARFAEHLRTSGWLDGVSKVVVGVSGGMDSMVLLHLMRFGEGVWSAPVHGPPPAPVHGPPPAPVHGLPSAPSHGAPPVQLHAAHIDHRMREGSTEEAARVADVCADWEVPCRLHRAPEPVASEERGRELRHRFFEEVRQSLGDGAVTMTGHTADDQAETVLFRAARGSGIRGLAGIRPVRSPSVVRPLLTFRRRELERYAAAHGVPFREDPTNRDPRWIRNRLRHQILPALEEAVPGAAGALAALAGTSRLHSAALDELLDARLAALGSHTGAERTQTERTRAERTGAERSGRELSLDRKALCTLSDPVLTLAMRRAVARVGGEAGRGATAALVRFVRESPSGRSIDVGGGVVAERRLAAVRIRRRERAPRPLPPPAAVQIGERGGGQGVFARREGKGGAVRVAWGTSPRPRFPHVARIPRDGVPFPLVFRAWESGDRVKMPYGRKKVKKLLLEARVPADRREHFPVLADAAGRVLWIPGVTDPVAAATGGSGDLVCCVAVSFDDQP